MKNEGPKKDPHNIIETYYWSYHKAQEQPGQPEELKDDEEDQQIA